MTRFKKAVEFHPAGLLVALKRWVFFILWEIAFTGFSIVLIMGEDVFWKLNFVDNIYTRLNTNTGDTWIFTWITVTFTGISLMILWNAGILGWLSDWAEANL